MEMLTGDLGVKMCRTPEIMADAAYAILLHTCDQMTGQFLIDDNVVTKAGITDLDQYANSPGKYYYMRWNFEKPFHIVISV